MREYKEYTKMNNIRERSRDSWRTTLPLRYSDQQRRNPYAPIPGHKNPGESVKLPRRVWYDAKWRARRSTSDKYRRQGVRTQMKIHTWTVIIQSSENRKSRVKLISSKSDCIRLGYGPMRLVHRRNNPNKETLIYIPFVSCHRISKRIESELQIIWR